MKVGFIGLGIMGSRMAANLQKKGYELVVYNRNASKADELARGGAERMSSPAGVALKADLLITMLANPEAVRATAFGTDGFLDALKPGALWVDCSTVNPSFTREEAAAAHARGLRFMDAPVAGSRIPAEKGQLTFFVGGSAADVEECRPLFEAMGQKIVHVGEVGMGSSVKVVLNLLLAVQMAAFSEGLVLGEALGIPRTTLLDILQNSAVVAPAAAGKRAKIENGDFSPDFPLVWMQKDLHLAAVSAYEQGIALPITNTAKELYALAAKYGLAEQDFSAIYRFLREGQDGG